MKKIILIIAIVFVAISAQAQLSPQVDLSKDSLWTVTEACLQDRFGLACEELPALTPMTPTDEIRIYAVWGSVSFVEITGETTLFTIDQYCNEIVAKNEAIQAVYGERVASTVNDTIYVFNKNTSQVEMVVTDVPIIESDGQIVGYELKDNYFFDNKDGEFKIQGFSDQTTSLLRVLKKVDDKYYIIGL